MTADKLILQHPGRKCGAWMVHATLNVSGTQASVQKRKVALRPLPVRGGVAVARLVFTPGQRGAELEFFIEGIGRVSTWIYHKSQQEIMAEADRDCTRWWWHFSKVAKEYFRPEMADHVWRLDYDAEGREWLRPVASVFANEHSRADSRWLESQSDGMYYVVRADGNVTIYQKRGLNTPLLIPNNDEGPSVTRAFRWTRNGIPFETEYTAQQVADRLNPPETLDNAN